jgi:hypothetical protein
MNIQKLNAAIAGLKSDLEEGLIATDIWSTADGQSMAGINPQPQACALFNRITNYMIGALKGAGFPELGRYYILDLTNNSMVIIIPMGDFQWGMLIDRTKTQMGLMLNVILPKIVDNFEEAMSE